MGKSREQAIISEAMTILAKRRMARLSPEELRAHQIRAVSANWSGLTATERQIEMRRRMALWKSRRRAARKGDVQ